MRPPNEVDRLVRTSMHGGHGVASAQLSEYDWPPANTTRLGLLYLPRNGHGPCLGPSAYKNINVNRN